MKNFIKTILLLIFSSTFFCSLSAQQCNCPADNSVPNKHVRVILHYVMKSNGSGNFNKDDDGYGNINNNAYAFSKLLIKEVNKKLSTLNPNWKSPTNSLTATDANWRVVLAGVNFIKSDLLYEFDHYASSITPYESRRISPWNTINIFILNQSNRNGTPSLTSGQAFRSKKMTIHTDRSYKNYLAFNKKFEDFIIREAAGNFIHELGHIFSLDHDWWAQFCDMQSYSSSCTSGCSNNYMSYNYADAAWAGSFTSCQVNRMISDIENTHSTTVHLRTDNCNPQLSNCHLEVNNKSTSTDFWLYTGNYDYSNYFIETYQTACNGCSFVIPGTYLGSWYNRRSQDLEHKISLKARTFRNFLPNSWYKVKFVVQDPCGNWIESNNWINSNQNTNTFVSGGEKILKSINREGEISIYPNPASSEINIISKNDLSSISIFNVQGIMIGDYSSSKNIDISNYSPGIYYIKIATNEGKEYMEKVVISR